jgi:hypothetical protein
MVGGTTSSCWSWSRRLKVWITFGANTLLYMYVFRLVYWLTFVCNTPFSTIVYLPLVMYLWANTLQAATLGAYCNQMCQNSKYSTSGQQHHANIETANCRRYRTDYRRLRASEIRYYVLTILNRVILDRRAARHHKEQYLEMPSGRDDERRLFHGFSVLSDVFGMFHRDISHDIYNEKYYRRNDALFQSYKPTDASSMRE